MYCVKQQVVSFKDLGLIFYAQAWDIQENFLQQNIKIKLAIRKGLVEDEFRSSTTQHYLLFCEHYPVYTLGKNGKVEHILINEENREKKGIEFVKTNRGGDITFHGPKQLVVYPILDLEKFDTDIGKYLRRLEEVVIQTLAHFNIRGERSIGETGVWINVKGKARKICAIGVRCSRWITMHGLALNINTDLEYFNYIIPCGIVNKEVTSMQKELGEYIGMAEVKNIFKVKFEEVFNSKIEAINYNLLETPLNSPV